MNKRYLSILLLIVAAILVTGCSAKEETATAESAAGAATTRQMPELTKLMLGTFKLEGSENAVTPEQAGKLLPLWKMTRALSESDTVAREELEAVGTQISKAMTDAQIAAIDEMGLTMMDTSTIMEELGIEMERPDAAGDSDGNAPAVRPGGGQGPGGGQRPGGDEMMNPEQIATLRAERGGAAGGGMMMTGGPMYDALIELLAERAGA